VRFAVYNETRQSWLADRAEEAASARARLKGLLGRSTIETGEGLHIAPCNSIHMFFMRFAIDVAFLDKDRRVVRAIHSIRPWRATRVYLAAHSALELPAGTLAQTGTCEGDQLRFEDRPAPS
jgi:uncharacterized membrane protein (UPF0127 family)